MRTHRDSILIWAVAIVVAIAAMWVIATQADAASKSATEQYIVDSNYGSWCRNWPFGGCTYAGRPVAGRKITGLAFHGWRVFHNGYYQEWRRTGNPLRPIKLYECRNVAGWALPRHGVVIYYQRCNKA